MVDKVKNRVLYAQADHTFVDILFSFMTLPLGSLVRQLGKQNDHKQFDETLSSLNNLYQSLVDLPECYFSKEEFKYMLLNPTSPSYNLSRKLKVKIDDTAPKTYYVLPANDDCVDCGMFVSDISSFIVTDDLLVMPYTPGCCIQLLTELGVTDTAHLEERTVDFGYEKILDLLRLSMSNIFPLTYLVLSNKIMQIKPDEYCTSFSQANFISSKMLLQVCLQKSSGKLLFAEAEEDFVDFAFGFLSISLGTLIGTFMNVFSSFVFMNNIFRSIMSADLGKYFKSSTIKDILTKPHFGHHRKSKNHIYIVPSTESLSFVPTRRDIFDSLPTQNYPIFKRSGMFIVTDDLAITSSLSVSTMEILNKYQVPLNDIERHKLSIDFEEGLRILKASPTSKSALTKGLEHQLKTLNQNR